MKTFLPCGLYYLVSPIIGPALRRVRGDSCPALPGPFFQTGPYAELFAVYRLMAIFPNFTHNILDLLTIRNASMPVAVPFHAESVDLQIERIIGVAQRGYGSLLRMIFDMKFY